MRKHKGNPPPPREWELIHSFGKKWVLYRRRKSKSDWVNFKLISIKPRRKANYWFSFYPYEEKISINRDTLKLMKHFPTLFNRISKAIKE